MDTMTEITEQTYNDGNRNAGTGSVSGMEKLLKQDYKSMLASEEAKVAKLKEELQKHISLLNSLRQMLGKEPATINDDFTMPPRPTIPTKISPDNVRILWKLADGAKTIDEISDFVKASGKTIKKTSLAARLRSYERNYGLVERPTNDSFCLTSKGLEFLKKRHPRPDSSVKQEEDEQGS